MWSVSADRDLWWLSDAGELEIIHALFELVTERKGTVRVEANGGSELVFAFRFAAQRSVRIYTPVRYSIGDLSLEVGQTLAWDQKLRIQGGRTSISSAEIVGGSLAADVLLRSPRAFE